MLPEKHLNGVGNKIGQTNEDEEITLWGYDAANQLISEGLAFDLSWQALQVSDWGNLSVDQWGALPVSGTPDEITTFTYDAVGNRVQVETATEITTSTYDAANQLQWSEDNAGLTTYTYDANGNQASVQSPSEELTTYLWDYENRLAVLQQADDSLITYTYDPANQQDEYLVLKETEEDATHYLWDNNNILQEYDLSTQAQYNYAPHPYGDLISQHREAESSYYHYDGNFSTAALTDQTQTETDTYKYTAWGESKSATGSTDNPFTYKGEIGYYQDADGLQLLRNRRYSTQQGRFISEDPIGLDSEESNFYRYVANNPVNAVDPDGEQNCPKTRELTKKLLELNRERLRKAESINGINSSTANKFRERVLFLEECLAKFGYGYPKPTPAGPIPTPPPHAPPHVPQSGEPRPSCSSAADSEDIVEVRIPQSTSSSQFPPSTPEPSCSNPTGGDEPRPLPLKCAPCEDKHQGLRTTPFGGYDNVCMVIVNEIQDVGEPPIRVLFDANSDSDRDDACALAAQLKGSRNLEDVQAKLETGAAIVKEGVAIVTGADNIELVLEIYSDATSSNDTQETSDVPRTAGFGGLGGAATVAAIYVVSKGLGRLKRAKRRKPHGTGGGKGSPNKTPLPKLKQSDFGPKIASEIPKNGVPNNWSKPDIINAISDFEISISTRKAEQRAFEISGVGSNTERIAHARRITEEEDFLYSLKHALENCK